MSIEFIRTARSKFPLGRVVLTDNAQARLDFAAVLEGIYRHANGDWGDLTPEDARANADALQRGGRIMSVYGLTETRFWVITEADRSVTTVLLPLDY